MGPEGPAGPPGTARAYAVVDPACPFASNGCAVSKSHNIGTVRRVSTGRYCIQGAAGVSSLSFPGLAAVEYSKTAAPQGATSASVSASNTDTELYCSEGWFMVVTNRMAAVTAKDSSNQLFTAMASPAPANDVGFTIVIP